MKKISKEESIDNALAYLVEIEETKTKLCELIHNDEDYCTIEELLDHLMYLREQYTKFMRF